MLGLSPDGKQYSEKIEVKAFDCDMTRRMSVSSMLRYMEEVADHHLTEFGLPYSILAQDGVVFLLATVQIKVHRLPTLRENLTVTTWQRCVKGVKFFRDTEFCDSDGNIVIESTSVWVLCDPAEHKIKRPRDYEKCSLIKNNERELFGDGKVSAKLTENAQKIDTRRVVYSDIDYNHHLNNTKYADIICDYVEGLGKTCEITEFSILFSSEAFLGDELDIMCEKKDCRSYAFVGNHPRSKCFEATVCVREINTSGR